MISAQLKSGLVGKGKIVLKSKGVAMSVFDATTSKTNVPMQFKAVLK